MTIRTISDHKRFFSAHRSGSDESGAGSHEAAPTACTFTAGAVLGSPPVKLTAAQVAEMRRLSARGARQRVLAARFGVSPAHVSMILRGKRWADSSRPPDASGPQ